MLTDSIKNHPFASAVWKDAVAVQIYLKDKGLDVESADLDEYQYYIMRVRYSLAHLVTWMERLEHAVHYLSDLSYSNKVRREGINRTHHLLYNVENYLIRLQSVYDRSLQLTNRIFIYAPKDQTCRTR